MSICPGHRICLPSAGLLALLPLACLTPKPKRSILLGINIPTEITSLVMIESRHPTSHLRPHIMRSRCSVLGFLSSITHLHLVLFLCPSGRALNYSCPSLSSVLAPSLPLSAFAQASVPLDTALRVQKADDKMPTATGRARWPTLWFRRSSLTDKQVKIRHAWLDLPSSPNSTGPRLKWKKLREKMRVQ